MALLQQQGLVDITPVLGFVLNLPLVFLMPPCMMCKLLSGGPRKGVVVTVLVLLGYRSACNNLTIITSGVMKIGRMQFREENADPSLCISL